MNYNINTFRIETQGNNLSRIRLALESDYVETVETHSGDDDDSIPLHTRLFTPNCVYTQLPFVFICQIHKNNKFMQGFCDSFVCRILSINRMMTFNGIRTSQNTAKPASNA